MRLTGVDFRPTICALLNRHARQRNQSILEISQTQLAIGHERKSVLDSSRRGEFSLRIYWVRAKSRNFALMLRIEDGILGVDVLTSRELCGREWGSESDAQPLFSLLSECCGSSNACGVFERTMLSIGLWIYFEEIKVNQHSPRRLCPSSSRPPQGVSLSCDLSCLVT